jgi:hypothetical protein
MLLLLCSLSHALALHHDDFCSTRRDRADAKRRCIAPVSSAVSMPISQTTQRAPSGVAVGPCRKPTSRPALKAAEIQRPRRALSAMQKTADICIRTVVFGPSYRRRASARLTMRFGFGAVICSCVVRRGILPSIESSTVLDVVAALRVPQRGASRAAESLTICRPVETQNRHYGK